ncbi:hypothetical protein DFJ58DRAFT_838359 [Suillus subalutaceus]|uniref:uncharacterized protein n=1 Tax=Suillus subalutaceus TaxID=48586 RepID=UPI001B87C54C|nr:uncharacterized protein DFJ58DRAFT_838359 [Suillus subalutaceus]KAG1866577.1 hypothetical protein DFJ58DRAFT_838359 [Suillus subalutaceus]
MFFSLSSELVSSISFSKRHHHPGCWPTTYFGAPSCEFLEHPDYLLCIVTSPVMCHLYQMCYNAFDERRGLWLDINFCNEYGTLWSNSEKPPMAFLVALGGISTACARFMGLIILHFDLRKLELWRWEIYLAWSWLFIAGAADMYHSSTCTCATGQALTMSVMFVTLELYIIGRLLSFIAPPFLEFKHRIGAVTDTRVLHALSLLLFDILNLVPGVKAIGIIGEFVPFSIGALIVLDYTDPSIDKQLIQHCQMACKGGPKKV